MSALGESCDSNTIVIEMLAAPASISDTSRESISDEDRDKEDSSDKETEDSDHNRNKDNAKDVPKDTHSGYRIIDGKQSDSQSGNPTKEVVEAMDIEEAMDVKQFPEEMSGCVESPNLGLHTSCNLVVNQISSHLPQDVIPPATCYLVKNEINSHFLQDITKESFTEVDIEKKERIVGGDISGVPPSVADLSLVDYLESQTLQHSIEQALVAVEEKTSQETHNTGTANESDFKNNLSSSGMGSNQEESAIDSSNAVKNKEHTKDIMDIDTGTSDVTKESTQSEPNSPFRILPSNNGPREVIRSRDENDNIRKTPVEELEEGVQKEATPIPVQCSLVSRADDDIAGQGTPTRSMVGSVSEGDVAVQEGQAVSPFVTNRRKQRPGRGTPSSSSTPNARLNESVHTPVLGTGYLDRSTDLLASPGFLDDSISAVIACLDQSAAEDFPNWKQGPGVEKVGNRVLAEMDLGSSDDVRILADQTTQRIESSGSDAFVPEISSEELSKGVPSLNQTDQGNKGLQISPRHDVLLKRLSDGPGGDTYNLHSACIGEKSLERAPDTVYVPGILNDGSLGEMTNESTADQGGTGPGDITCLITANKEGQGPEPPSPAAYVPMDLNGPSSGARSTDIMESQAVSEPNFKGPPFELTAQVPEPSASLHECAEGPSPRESIESEAVRISTDSLMDQTGQEIEICVPQTQDAVLSSQNNPELLDSSIEGDHSSPSEKLEDQLISQILPRRYV